MTNAEKLARLNIFRAEAGLPEFKSWKTSFHGPLLEVFEEDAAREMAAHIEAVTEPVKEQSRAKANPAKKDDYPAPRSRKNRKFPMGDNVVLAPVAGVAVPNGHMTNVVSYFDGKKQLGDVIGDVAAALVNGTNKGKKVHENPIVHAKGYIRGAITEGYLQYVVES